MTEEKTFTQAQIDQIVRDRVQAKDEEISRLQGQLTTHKKRILDMETTSAVGRVNIKAGAASKALRMADFDGVSVAEDGTVDTSKLDASLRSVLEEVPELASAPVSVGGGSNPSGGGGNVPLSRDDIKGMSPEEINSRWDQVRRVLSGS